MQKRLLLPLLLTPMLVSACAFAPSVDHLRVIGPEPRTESGAAASGSSTSAVDVRAMLSAFDGAALNGTGGVRFLATGILEFGETDAPHTLTVFTEYHCGYCREFHRSMLPSLIAEFADPGALKIRIVPFEIHKYVNSRTANQALLCAGKAGSGSAMHTVLAERENKHRSSVIEYAEEIGIDATSFTGCLDAEETSALLTMQRQTAEALGITLVPAFVLDDEMRTGLPLPADLRGWIEQKQMEE